MPMCSWHGLFVKHTLKTAFALPMKPKQMKLKLQQSPLAPQTRLQN